MALVPWPDTTELASAITLLKDSISLPYGDDAQALSDAVITRVGKTAALMISQYIDGATVPDEIKDEAAIRISGYLLNASPAYTQYEIESGNFDVIAHYRGTGALRSSGAMSLLSPYKKRGLGVIE